MELNHALEEVGRQIMLTVTKIEAAAGIGDSKQRDTLEEMLLELQKEKNLLLRRQSEQLPPQDE